MLIGIDANMTPDLLDCLMRMGHGDEIVVADANFPAGSTAAHTHWGDVIPLSAMTAPDAIRLITGVMPLDGFSDVCAWRMQIDNAPDDMGEVHTQAFDILSAAMPEGAALGSIERQTFYQRARMAFGVVATTDMRPYGCFILRKGVIF